MRKRNLLTGICCLLLAGWLNLASAAEGLILGFSAANEVSLTSVTAAERVPSPRSFPGPNWTLAAIEPDGRLRWSRALAAPREFHSDPDSAVSFSAIVPGVLVGDRLSMTDAQGFVLWTRIVDDALLLDGINNKRKLQQSLDAAYVATRKLQQHRPAHGLAGDPGQVEVARNKRSDPSIPKRNRQSPISAKVGQGETLYHVGGTVVVNTIDVRVFDAATKALIVSTPTDWTNGRYDFDLPRGNYEFEVDDNRLTGDLPFFYRKPYRTAPIRISANSELPVIPLNDAAGQFVLRATVSCSLIPTTVFARGSFFFPTVTIVSEDGTRIRRISERIGIVGPESTAGSGNCPVEYSIQLSPGVYSIEIGIPGWEAVQFDTVEIDDGGIAERDHFFAAADRTLVWTGEVVDKFDNPVNSLIVTMIDELDEGDGSGVIDYLPGDSTHFVLPYLRGWTIEFEPTWITGNQTLARKRQLLDGRAPPAKIILDDIAAGNIIDSGLLRIVGDGARENHYNILFLGDGYTDVHETFTDTNGNGVWDGIVWYDMDGDGLYDGAHDRSRIYGSNGYQHFPEPDPASENEPFVDINNDGILNVDDPAEFESNARDFMRFFLGSDFWSEHKQAFNAYLLFEPSAEAGFDIETETGQLAVERNTRYDAILSQPRMLMGVDRQAAMNRALSVLPEVDMVVILVNQSVVTLARGNVTFSQPGSMVWPSGLSPRSIVDMGPSHEMGHFVATLCDEYSEFPGVSPSHGNPSTGCPNTSYLNDPTLVPWSNWIPPGTGTPTRNLDGSIGIYEGAQYYEGGAYRPTFNSTMRFLSPLFNAPSRAALETAVHTRTGEWRDAADDYGRCELLPPRAIRRQGLTCH
jgi:hypothetical protein